MRSKDEIKAVYKHLGFELPNWLKYDAGQARDKGGRWTSGGVGGGSTSPTVIEGREVYQLRRGQRLPDSILNGRGIVLISKDGRLLAAQTNGPKGNLWHADLASLIDMSLEDFDDSIRVKWTGKSIALDSSSAGLGRVRFSMLSDIQIDKRAERKLPRAAAALISAGFPAATPTRWNTSTGAAIRTTLKEWTKSYLF